MRGKNRGRGEAREVSREDRGGRSARRGVRAVPGPGGRGIWGAPLRWRRLLQSVCSGPAPVFPCLFLRELDVDRLCKFQELFPRASGNHISVDLQRTDFQAGIDKPPASWFGGRRKATGSIARYPHPSRTPACPEIPCPPSRGWPRRVGRLSRRLRRAPGAARRERLSLSLRRGVRAQVGGVRPRGAFKSGSFSMRPRAQHGVPMHPSPRLLLCSSPKSMLVEAGIQSKYIQTLDRDQIQT